MNLSPSANLDPSINLEKLDFLKTRALRQSINLRECGHCFYCLRRTDARVQCLDHVVPRVKAGCNSYRNLVSCCLECNSLKGERSATDFLRSLYRERRLTTSELHARLRALDTLSSGKLPPPLQHPDTPERPLPTHACHPERSEGSAFLSPLVHSGRNRGVCSRAPSAFANDHRGINPMPRKGRPPRLLPL